MPIAYNPKVKEKCDLLFKKYGYLSAEQLKCLIDAGLVEEHEFVQGLWFGMLKMEKRRRGE